MKQKYIYLVLFSILYLFTAFVSTTHAIAFFSLANVFWMGVLLAITFEIGQAAVLFSILTDKSQTKKILPWCLMSVLTFVQILGNVFSSYKYILTNSVEDLKYFKEPIFIWTDLPDDITTVIVTYLLGAILPIICLLLTSMVTNYLNSEENNDSNNKDNIINKQEENSQEEINQVDNQTNIVQDITTENNIDKEDNKKEEINNELVQPTIIPTEISTITPTVTPTKEIKISKETEQAVNEILGNGTNNINKPKKESHFINI